MKTKNKREEALIEEAFSQATDYVNELKGKHTKDIDAMIDVLIKMGQRLLWSETKLRRMEEANSKAKQSKERYERKQRGNYDRSKS